jgi:hypothetical protein
MAVDRSNSAEKHSLLMFFVLAYGLVWDVVFAVWFKPATLSRLDRRVMGGVEA